MLRDAWGEPIGACIPSPRNVGTNHELVRREAPYGTCPEIQLPQVPNAPHNRPPAREARRVPDSEAVGRSGSCGCSAAAGKDARIWKFPLPTKPPPLPQQHTPCTRGLHACRGTEHHLPLNTETAASFRRPHTRRVGETAVARKISRRRRGGAQHSRCGLPFRTTVLVVTAYATMGTTTRR